MADGNFFLALLQETVRGDLHMATCLEYVQGWQTASTPCHSPFPSAFSVMVREMCPACGNMDWSSYLKT